MLPNLSGGTMNGPWDRAEDGKGAMTQRWSPLGSSQPGAEGKGRTEHTEKLN